MVAKPDTPEQDCRKIRDGLAALKTTDGLLGEIQRTGEGEALKPYVFVHAEQGAWTVLHNPL